MSYHPEYTMHKGRMVHVIAKADNIVDLNKTTL